MSAFNLIKESFLEGKGERILFEENNKNHVNLNIAYHSIGSRIPFSF